ncbi:MAG: hypothetical protein ACK4ON_03160 [Bacteroidia bacterium]
MYSFQSLNDPLLKGLMLEYLLRINNSSDKYEFHLITHEQKVFKQSKEQIYITKKSLLKNYIYWYPINYKTGNFLLIKKLINFVQSLVICIKIKFKFKPNGIVGFLPIAGGYSYIVSKLLNLKLIVFCFEPHSEYMADFGIWKKNSLKYKLLNKFEKLQIKHAQHITLPTNYSIELANKINTNNSKYYLPISVDTELFKFDGTARDMIRKKISASDKTVIIYTGKFGGIYYSFEIIFNFFKSLYDINNKYFFYVITPNYNEIINILKKNQDEKYYISPPVAYEKLNEYLSAADIGLIAIPPYPSQKYRTPVKTGLYLSCGLPYIVNKGVAEDDIIAECENVGIAINNIEHINAAEINNKITTLLSEERKTLMQRCRNTAIKHHDTKLSVKTLKNIFEKI